MSINVAKTTQTLSMEYCLSDHTQSFGNKQLRPLMEMWKCVQWK